MNKHVLFGFGLLLLTQILSTLCDDPPDPKYDWDVLIFTQRWPLTACSQWKEHSQSNTCAFPDPEDLWTIHGIWPTKPGTKGPLNCNSTWHFNETVIDPIKSQLEEYWTNVEKNTKLTSLWSHEWCKHGTCAAVLPKLSNELLYFQQGLEWIQKYNMKTVLSQQNVIPNEQGYSVQKFFDSVKSVLKKTAIIQCVVDKNTKLSLVSEIRICFDKSLKLMDCDTVKEEDFLKVANVLTNCNIKKPVMYPNKIEPYTTTSRMASTKTRVLTRSTATVPNVTTTMSTLDSLYNTRQYLLTLHRTIKLLIWATI